MKNVFTKSKIAIAVILASTALAGCDSGDTTNAAVDAVQEVTIDAVPATVSGIVRDTNGNGIEGASVAIVGNEAVLTDATGAYLIPDVRVTNFNANNQAGGDELTVTVNIDGYMRTMVKVEVTNANVSYNNTTADVAADNADVVAVAIQQGIAVAADDAVIPKLGAGISGVLRNAETGESIPNAKVALDFVALNAGVAAVPGQVLGSSTLIATSDDNGLFVFENLPVNSDFKLDVEGWNAETNAPISTASEYVVERIADLNVLPFVFEDTIFPVVTSVNRVYADNGAGVGLLDDDAFGDNATGGFRINFSERLAAEQDLEPLIDDNSIVVIATVDGQDTIVDIQSVALAADGKSLYLETLAPIAGNTDFRILLLRPDFEDTAGNTLNVAKDGNPLNLAAGNLSVPVYDSTIPYGDASYVELKLHTYKDPKVGGDAVTALAQDAETASTNLHAVNFSFASVVDSTNQQLNAAEAETRLETLGAAISGGATNVVIDVAQATFTLPADVASTYKIEVSRNGTVISGVAGAPGVLVGIFPNNTLNPAENITVAQTYDAESVQSVWMSGVQHNDVITVTAANDYGIIVGEPQSAVLHDQVAPTTVLQQSYFVNTAATAGAGVAAINYGDGGELSEDVAGSVAGTPILAVTPRLFSTQNVVQPYTTAVSPWAELSAIINDDTVNLAGAYGAGNTALNTATAYDKAGYAAWNVVSRRVGVAFSESIAAVAAATPAETGISATLSGWTVQNDVTVSDSATAALTDIDLMTFVTNDVLELANTDHNGVIDFTDAVADTANNNVATADNNAKVVLSDRMPPMITEAVFTGLDLVVTFSEPVVLSNGTQFMFDGLAADQVVTIASTINITNTGNVYTIPLTAFAAANASAILNTFDRGLNNGAAVARSLTLLSSANLEDARGNSWSDWDLNAAVTEQGVATPQFIATNSIGAFQTTKTQPNFEAGETTYTLTAVYTHPIVDATITTADLDLTNNTNGSTFNVANTNITQSTDKRTITINVSGATLVAGDEIWILPQVSDLTAENIAKVVFTVLP